MEKINLQNVKEYAYEKHGEINHMYADYLPYSYHLNLVATVAEKYIQLIPDEDQDLVRGACYLHDSLEDCHISYNDLKLKFGTEIAEIVYALTNEKGRNRHQRANSKYYEGIRVTKYATFVKLCDRIANALFSCMFGSSQFDMYKKENKEFVNALFNQKYLVMFSDLSYLFESKQFGFEPHEV